MSNRTTRITKLYNLLKKRYKFQPVAAGRNLFEHFLFACLLEDGSQDTADEGIARLEQDYFDWNEVRVTTVSELSESLHRLPNPLEAAARLKKNLHALFENYYSFDIEELKKQNLGKTVKEFSEFPAMTPFVLAYFVQQGLGGHAIPVNSAALDIFYYCGIISESEKRSRKVPGIERAISKSKGAEFSSLLHQLSLDFAATPKDPDLRAIILKVNPAAEELLPGAKKKAAVKSAAKKTSKSSKSAPAKKKTNKKSTASKTATKKKSSAKATKSKKKTTPKKSPKKSTKSKSTKAKRSPTKKLSKKKPR